MAQTQVRVPGGGNTFIAMGLANSKGKGYVTNLAFLANVNDRPGPAVGRVTPIHPIGHAYPVDIAIPYAQSMGTLTLTVWATWGKDGWVSAFMNNYNRSPWKNYKAVHNFSKHQPCDLREVLEAQRLNGGYLLCKKYERGRNGKIARVKNYQKCLISDIDASDNVSIDTMEQRVTITCNYAYVTVTSGADSNNKGISNSGIIYSS